MKRIMCTTLVLTYLFHAAMSHAIVRRHDVADSHYTSAGAAHSSVVAVLGPISSGSGTLIAPDWILTAAHVVHDIPESRFDEVTIRNGATWHEGTQAIGVEDMIILPGFVFSSPNQASFKQGLDIALIHLSQPLSVAPMQRYAGAPSSLLGNLVQYVGYGNTGVGTVGGNGEVNWTAGTKRSGTNVIDILGNSYASSYSNNILMSDFDGPTTSDPNRWGSGTPTAREANVAHGDSGGPVVIGNSVAGVATLYSADYSDNIYGEWTAYATVQPHRAWINATMGGVNWIGRGNSGFRTNANWGDGVVPTGQDVRFNLPDITGQSAPVITHNANNNVARMTVEFGRHDFDMNGFAFTTTGLATVTNNGALFVRDGVLVTNARLDISHGGRVELPTGGRLDANNPEGSNDALYIGNLGGGTLNQNGGRIDVDGNTYVAIGNNSSGNYNQDTGNAYFDGNVFLAGYGQGTWSHSGGGSASVTGNLVLGYRFEGRGSYYKTGSGNLNVIKSTTGFGPGHFVVGSYGEGWVESSDGLIQAVQLRLGDNVDSSGTFYNRGTAALTSNELIQIGIAGRGDLRVEGGIVSTTTGSITLGSSATGDGTLRVSGGSVSTSQTIVVGNAGKGSVFVSSNGNLQGNAISLARASTAKGIYGQSGGLVTIANNFYIGDSATASDQSMATISGGKLTVGTKLYVGSQGKGSWLQTDGNVEVNGPVHVGDDFNAVGVMTFTGGSFSTNDTMRVPYNGSGDVHQSGTAQVTIAGNLHMGVGGAYTLDGGDLNIGGNVFNVDPDLAAGTFNFTGGTLQVGTFNGDLHNQGGMLKHNNWDSETTITGNYEQDQLGSLQFDIGDIDTNPLSVLGEAYLDGSIAVSLFNDFDPTGYAFNIFNSQGTLSGPLADLAYSPTGARIETLDGLGSFRLSAEIGGLYEGYNLWLDDYQPAPPSLPGDFDNDGDVDGRDFLAWQRNPGLGDLAQWHDNYSASGLLVGDVSAVPEPSCVAMAVTGAVILIFNRRRALKC